MRVLSDIDLSRALLASAGAGTAGQVLTSGGAAAAISWTTPSSGWPTDLTQSDDTTGRVLYLSGNTTVGAKGYDVSFAGGNYGSPVTKWGAQFTMGGATSGAHGAFTFSGRNVNLDSSGNLWLAGSISAPNLLAVDINAATFYGAL